MRPLLIFGIAWTAIASAACGQLCPVRRAPKRVDSGFDNGVDPSAQRPITGTIVYHDNLRRWIGLRPQEPVCGQSEFQIWIPDNPEHFREMRKQVESFRGCTATITGRLSFGDGREDASAIILQPDSVRPDPACAAKPGLPDFSRLRARPDLQTYEVTLRVSLAGEGSVRVQVRGHGRELRPWQAYATYKLDDGHIVSATCGYGFVVDSVNGKHDEFSKVTGSALLDLQDVVPGGADASGVLTYTCNRVAANSP